MEKLIKTLQYIWLGIAITAIIMGTYFTVANGFKEGMIYFLFTFAAGIMFAVNKRRYRNYVESTKKNVKD